MAKIEHRLVLYFPGFEPITAETQYSRFVREAKKTAQVYGMELIPGAVTSTGISNAADAAITCVSSSGNGWHTKCDIVFYGLSHFNSLYSLRPNFIRFTSGLFSLADFLITGTFFRFIATSWRYGLFFLYPILITTVQFSIAYAFAWVPPTIFGPIHGWWSIPLAPLVFWICVIFSARYMHFLLIMDDWKFAADIARNRFPLVQANILDIAADVEQRLRTTEADEIVVAAHSFGAITAAIALSDALRSGANGNRQIGFLTTGSSLLKVALHPAACRLRAAVSTIASGKCSWIDVQSLTDPMNFYHSDPVRDLNISNGRRPSLIKVRFRNQLSTETYHAIRRDFFRIHRQFVMAVERRSHYSLHAILCGPEKFTDVAERAGLAPDWNFSDAATKDGGFTS